MLTLEDCEDFTDLTKEEIDAIAEHEHISEIAAAATGNCLSHSTEGLALIRRYILEDIENAKSHGDKGRAQHWRQVYNRFSAGHPIP
jgi:hypothetical protein